MDTHLINLQLNKLSDKYRYICDNAARSKGTVTTAEVLIAKVYLQAIDDFKKILNPDAIVLQNNR